MNRRTRILLPMTDHLLEPTLRTDTKSKFAKDEMPDLVVLEEGNVVRMKPYSPNITWKKVVITKRLDERSYQVDTDSRTYHRNSHLRKTNESDPLNDAYSSTINAKVKRYVADQPAMSDYSLATPVSEDVHNDTPTSTQQNNTPAPMPTPTQQNTTSAPSRNRLVYHKDQPRE